MYERLDSSVDARSTEFLMIQALRCSFIGAVFASIAWLFEKQFWILILVFWVGFMLGLCIGVAHNFFGRNDDE
jgi:hypothetical protein